MSCFTTQTSDGIARLELDLPDEAVVRSPRDGDIGAIFGIGFPPFRGGPFRFLDQVGAGQAVEVLERLRSKVGERFAPAPHLIEMAKQGLRFHAKPGTAAKAPRCSSSVPRLGESEK